MLLLYVKHQENYVIKALRKSPILTFFCPRGMLPGGCQRGVPARGVLWAHKQVCQAIQHVYITLQSSASLTGIESTLNEVQPSLGQLTDSLCQAPPALGRPRSPSCERPRSPSCETPRRVGRCSGWCKVSLSQVWVWDAAYSNSCSSTPSANGNKNRGGAVNTAMQHTGEVISY